MDALKHSLARNASRLSGLKPIQHWALPSDDQMSTEEQLATVHRIARTLVDIAKDLDVESDAPYDSKRHDGSNYFVNTEQQLMQRQLMSDLREKINDHMQTNDTAVYLLEQIRPHASEDLEKVLDDLEAASAATTRVADFQVQSTMTALTQIEESLSAKPKRRAPVMPGFGHSPLTRSKASLATFNAEFPAPPTSPSSPSSSSGTGGGAAAANAFASARTKAPQWSAQSRLQAFTAPQASPTSQIESGASCNLLPSSETTTEPAPLDAEWDDDDWAEWQAHADAQRAALEAELAHTQALLKRARAQVVDLSIGSYRQQMKSMRMPGARKTEALTQTDPSHDEAIKHNLHQQINEKQEELDAMAKRLEEAERKLPAPLGPPPTLKATMKAAMFAGKLMHLPKPKKPDDKAVKSQTAAASAPDKAVKSDTAAASAPVLEPAVKKSFMMKGPPPISSAIKSTEKATMTEELADNVGALKAEIERLKVISESGISAEDHEREVDYLREKGAVQQRRLEARIRELEAADEGKVVATLQAKINRMRSGAKDLLSTLPMHVYAMVRSDAMSVFEMSNSEAKEVESAIQNPRTNSDYNSQGVGSFRSLDLTVVAAMGGETDQLVAQLAQKQEKLESKELEVVSAVLNSICQAVIEKDKLEATRSRDRRAAKFEIESAVKAATEAAERKAMAEAEVERKRIAAAMDEMVREAAAHVVVQEQFESTRGRVEAAVLKSALNGADEQLKQLDSIITKAYDVAEAAESRARASDESMASQKELHESQLTATRAEVASCMAMLSAVTKEVAGADLERTSAKRHFDELLERLELADMAVKAADEAVGQASNERLDAVRRLADIEALIASRERNAVEEAEQALADATLKVSDREAAAQAEAGQVRANLEAESGRMRELYEAKANQLRAAYESSQASQRVSEASLVIELGKAEDICRLYKQAADEAREAADKANQAAGETKERSHDDGALAKAEARAELASRARLEDASMLAIVSAELYEADKSLAAADRAAASMHKRVEEMTCSNEDYALMRKRLLALEARCRELQDTLDFSNADFASLSMARAGVASEPTSLSHHYVDLESDMSPSLNGVTETLAHSSPQARISRPGTASSSVSFQPRNWSEANGRAARTQSPHVGPTDVQATAAATHGFMPIGSMRNSQVDVLSLEQRRVLQLHEWRPNTPENDGEAPSESATNTQFAEPPSRPRSAKAPPAVVQRAHMWEAPRNTNPALGGGQPRANNRSSLAPSSNSARTPFVMREQQAIKESLNSSIQVPDAEGHARGAAAKLLSEVSLEGLIKNARGDNELKAIASMISTRIASLEESNKQLLSLQGTRVGTPASDAMGETMPNWHKAEGEWGRKHAETILQLALRGGSSRGTTPGSGRAHGTMRMSASIGTLPAVRVRGSALSLPAPARKQTPNTQSASVLPFTSGTSAYLSRGLITPEALIEETRRAVLKVGTRTPGTPSARGGGVAVGTPVEIKLEPARALPRSDLRPSSVTFDKGRPPRASGAITGMEARPNR